MENHPETPRILPLQEWATHSPDVRARFTNTRRSPLKLAALRRALSGTALETRYQPMVQMQSHSPVGMEALVRLQHSHQGTLYPGDFLPQVEKLGLAAIMTDTMATRAFTDWAALAPLSRRPMLSINFSLDVLLSPAALARLDERRDAALLPVDAILIELTESRPVEDLIGLRRSLTRVREAGYAVALDDITPSLPYLDALLDMQFTALKLDKGVVRAAPQHADAAAFIARIMTRASANGMTVTAEGVEDQKTWTTMRDLGIHVAQGYLIGEPMRAADIPIWLNDWGTRHPA